ncbi:MAG: BON domain-containing protein [Bryobacteraceae bacterium]
MLQRNGRCALTVLLAAGLTIAVGCSRKVDDSQLAQTIQSQIKSDVAINGQVSVKSLNGVVTLTGEVPSDAARALAEREAKDTAGVTYVINNLEVAPVTASKPRTRPTRKSADAAPKPVKAAPKEVATNVPPEEPSPFGPVTPAAAPPTLPKQAPAEAPKPTPPPPPAPVKYTIPAGKTIAIRLIDALDSTKNKEGDTFRATLQSPIRIDGEVAVPSGADVEGRVVDVANAGRFTGHAELKLSLTKLTSHGHVYPLNTEDYDSSGGGRGKGTAETVGGGAALGAIIGAIAGGGKGAGVGTLAGAGAGGVARGVKKGKGITFPSETVLTFKLTDPVTVTTMPGEDEASRR